MNRALGYLSFALLKRQAWHFVRGLRRPTSAIGLVALVFCGCLLFHYRHEDWLAQLVRRESLVGAALLLACGSLFQGFLRRGLLFELPDVEFLFTGPFTQRQIVVYRLVPHYLFALGQSAVFCAIFAAHLKHPLLDSAALALFQIACFHIATGAAIFAGTLSEPAHHRVRWMMLGVFAVLITYYFRAAWEIRLVPAFISSPLAQLFFYPAITISDPATAPLLGRWAVRLVHSNPAEIGDFWQPLFWLGACAVAALGTLGLTLRLKADIFETSLATTTRAAERRLRVQQGRSLATSGQSRFASVGLPRGTFFHGVVAIVWKNLVVALRSRRELALAFGFIFLYTGVLVMLRWLLPHFMADGGELPERQIAEFDNGIVGLLCVVPFFLQRAFPFDFRRDGNHLVGFRTLPVSPIALALAELAVPTGLCLAFQAFGIVALMSISPFNGRLLLAMLTGYPAVAVALNGVWNLQYLLAATRRAGGKGGSDSPVAALMAVVLSFLIFYPAVWAALKVGKVFDEKIAFASGIAVQYGVDFLLVLLLASLFQRFEVARDA